MTTQIEQDIQGIPPLLYQVLERTLELRPILRPQIHGPLALLGCGSSYCIARSAAVLYETATGYPAQALLASDYRSRMGWRQIGISRTGQTSELIEAFRRIKRTEKTYTLLLSGEQGSPAEELADETFPLEFAPEKGVIQTRFIVASLLALRLLFARDEDLPYLQTLPAQVERSLQEFDPQAFAQYAHSVFLGRDWRAGLASVAALNLQETARVVPEGHHTLDYRHGPIACADEQTVIWCFDTPSDSVSAAVMQDVRKTGATVYYPEQDPLVTLTEVFRFSLHRALQRGLDPEKPRHLSRAIILPQEVLE
ncbi:SIS domain-containing protein [Tengunoibacter tsumagoiensis]|uniref:Glutamine--fructose-6-phosphate aminotransferase [isomerizing] n=1 Tax=Tengunoibacter tsumagoiensis TaxID=2014871 RepID=A0A402A3X8_9CHLR|nr:SIS domain-containing protein [Tengunoibacter tsumagoiensis]GCE13857.1 hypothetical protein KTT_37160 [Tengunoibacter tsumagoiensis]